jgi:uncharacterized MAPEG superfamily protein
MLIAYHGVLAGWVLLGAVVLAQVLVNDVAGIRAKHVPGMPIVTGHSDFHFRAARAVGNTNEMLPLFLLLSVTAVLMDAAPRWASIFVWTFALSRLVYAICYYADWRLARSLVFGVGLLAQGALLGLCLLTLST